MVFALSVGMILVVGGFGKNVLRAPFSLVVHKATWLWNYWNELCQNPRFRRILCQGLSLVELLQLLSYFSVSSTIAG